MARFRARQQAGYLIFFPYKADIDLPRFPFVTVLVSLLCVVIFWQQAGNESRIVEKTVAFCQGQRSDMTEIMYKKISGDGTQKACYELMVDMLLNDNWQVPLENRLAAMKPVTGMSTDDGRAYARDILSSEYRRFRVQVPDYLTDDLYYDPTSWNPWRMLLSSFAHGDWMHLIGNLFFFFAFSATVEVILGPWLFAVTLLGLSTIVGSAYSLFSFGTGDFTPTLGLSGIVMGMIGLFVFFLPGASIRCFVWLLVVVVRFPLPAWLLALWFVGWDVWILLSNQSFDGVNVIAHVSGATAGYLLGFTFVRAIRENVGRRLAYLHRTRTRLPGTAKPEPTARQTTEQIFRD